MKKKVTIITESLYGGGVQRILQIICNHFDYERYNLTVYSVIEDTPRPPFYPSQISYKYIFNAFKQEYNIGKRIWIKVKNRCKLFIYYHFSPKLFYKLFIHEKTDVVIGFIEGYATRIVAGFPDNTKRIAWLHIELNNFHWSKIAYQTIEEEKEVYLSMSKIVCVANIVKEQIDNLYPVSNKTIVIHNPIDQDRILKLAQESLPENLIQKKYPVRIIGIGSLDSRKAHDRMLRITKCLKEENINYELWILGKGEKGNELKEFIHENNLDDRVKLLGYQDNPYPYLQAADIYVCSSYAEGYNTAITEALILGKAVVSTECSGVKEQLGENNEYGICTPNDDKGLYHGIKQMLNPNTLAYYTQKAQERGRSFTLENNMNKIYELLESL